MPAFTSARELVAPGETALFLFTDGRLFEFEGGIGSSGFWVLTDPQRPFQRVVVFRWTFRDGQRLVELFTALPEGLVGPETEGAFRGRYKVRLRDLRLAGTTTASWEDFVATDERPVTYVTGENAAHTALEPTPIAP
jgi:hypothetical protein